MPELKLFPLANFAASAALSVLSLQVALAKPPVPVIKEVSANAAALARISSEPDPNQQARSLRWSLDSAAVGWLQLVRPGPNGRDKSTQNEIWAIIAQGSKPPRATPLSTNPTEIRSQQSQQPQQPQQPASDPYLLLPAARVTDILRGSEPNLHRRLEDNDEQNNPYLLQDFLWSRDHKALLLIALHSLTWLDLSSGKAKPLLSGKQVISDVSAAPDGLSIYFIRDHKLWAIELTSKDLASKDAASKDAASKDSAGKDASGNDAVDKASSSQDSTPSPRQLTAPAHEDLFEAEPDWPYRNEFHVSRAYWLSPKSEQVAYLQIDDREVAKYALRASDGDATEIVYPKPGGNIPIVRVYVTRPKGGKPTEMQLGDTKNFYIPSVKWLPDGRHLAIERLDRRQHTLELLLADTNTGKVTPLLKESDQYWINLNDDLCFFADGKRFLWSSERAGFRHLYLYDIAGKQLAQLTKGDWEITNLDAVDEAQGSIYFTSTQQSVLERHLYRLRLEDNSITRMTQQPGTHQAFFAPDSAMYVDVFSSQITRPILALALANTTTNPISSIPKPIANQLQVEFLDLKLHQGLPVHAFILKPPAFDPSRKYPVIVYLAGGPGEQLVRDSWGGANGQWIQLMAQNGYIVFALDNQGSGARGHYFEEPIHLRLAGQELADQRDGLNYLESLPYVDPSRIGVCGWGYGGFLTIHAMLDRPLPFKAGFAGAAVTNWHFYDAIYAERYLDDPIAHADGWDASTALENAPYLKGSLMLALGTEDEFVHIENALTLQDELLDAGKSADLLLLSDRGHEIEDRPARLVLYTRMTEFFLSNL